MRVIVGLYIAGLVLLAVALWVQHRREARRAAALFAEPMPPREPLSRGEKLVLAAILVAAAVLVGALLWRAL